MTYTMTPASAPATWTSSTTWTPGWCTPAYWRQRTIFITIIATTSPSQRRRTSMWGLQGASTRRGGTVCSGPARPARGKRQTKTGGKRRQCGKGGGLVKSTTPLRPWSAARRPIQTSGCPKWRSCATLSATSSPCSRCWGPAGMTASTRRWSNTTGIRTPPAPAPTALMAWWVREQLNGACAASWNVWNVFGIVIFGYSASLHFQCRGSLKSTFMSHFKVKSFYSKPWDMLLQHISQPVSNTETNLQYFWKECGNKCIIRFCQI